MAAESLFERRAPLWLLGLLLLCFGTIYVLYAQTATEGMDTAGYVYAADQLAQGQLPKYCNDYNELIGPYFMYYAFSAKSNVSSACRFCSYPIGFPLLLAGAQWLTGHPQSMYYVVPLIGLLGLVGIFILGRLLFDSSWGGLWAALWLAVAPTYLYFATSPWSDMPGAVAALWGIALYLSCLRQRSPLIRAILAVLAGGLTGYGLWIRYANVITILPLAFYIVLSEKRHLLRNPSHYFFVGTLGLVTLGLLIYNRIYYGGFFLTGYSPEHYHVPSPLFSIRDLFGPSSFLGRTTLGVMRTLWENLSISLLLVPLALVRARFARAILVGGTALVVSLFYSLRASPPQGINARYLLLVLAMLSLLVGSALAFLIERTRKRPRLYHALLIAVTLLLLLPLPFRLRPLAERNQAILAKVRLVQDYTQSTEPNAVFLAYYENDLIIYYGHRTSLTYRRIPTPDIALRRYRLEELEPRLVESIDYLLQHDVPVYYIKDLSVPLWDSLAILERHYTLSRYRDQPEIYRIEGKGS